MKSKLFITTLATFGGFALSVSAQQGSAGSRTEGKAVKELPKEAHLAVLAIGAKPSLRYIMPDSKVGKSLKAKLSEEMKVEIEQLKKEGVKFSKDELEALKGNALLVPPHPQSVPPSMLITKGLEDQDIRLRVGFNSTPTFTRVPAQKELSTKRMVTEGSDSLKSYLKINPIAPGSRTLMIVSPPNKPPLMWKDVPGRASYINIDSPGAKGKIAIVVNNTAQALEFTLGKKVYKLSAQQRIALSPPSAAEYQPFSLNYSKGEKKLLTRGTIVVSKEALNLFVFYDANPKTNAGKLVGIYKTLIPLPKPITVEDSP